MNEFHMNEFYLQVPMTKRARNPNSIERVLVELSYSLGGKLQF